MKKLYSFLFSIGLVSAVSAQVEIREYTNTGGTQIGNDISGDTIFADVASVGDFTRHYAVKNVSGAQMYLRIKRLRIDVPGDWTDALCWGPDPDYPLAPEGACFTAQMMSTNPWTTPNAIDQNHAQTIGDQSIGDLKVEIYVNSDAPGHYRYYVMPNQGATPIDSIDIVINRSLGVVEDDKEEVLGMTAYPNPVNSTLTVNTTGTDNNILLRITDVLGKVVYNDVVAPTKKIDVSDYKNGVYLVSVYKEGVLVQTRRVVVKH